MDDSKIDVGKRIIDDQIKYIDNLIRALNGGSNLRKAVTGVNRYKKKIAVGLLVLFLVFGVVGLFFFKSEVNKKVDPESEALFEDLNFHQNGFDFFKYHGKLPFPKSDEDKRKIATEFELWDKLNGDQYLPTGSKNVKTEESKIAGLTVSKSIAFVARPKENKPDSGDEDTKPPIKKPEVKPEDVTKFASVQTSATCGSHKMLDGLVWPTQSCRQTSEFGEQRTTRKHPGIDIGGVTAGVVGDPIYAVKAGKVTTAGYKNLNGNWIKIDHGDNTGSVYLHMKEIHPDIKSGKLKNVKQGQQIGLMGNTGRPAKPYGVHLHFEYRVNGKSVNPLMKNAEKSDVAKEGSKEMKALLNAIAWAEGTGNSYNIMYGGSKFTKLTAHPVVTGEMPAKGIKAPGYSIRSTAAGRYQFMKYTYDELKGQGYFKTGFGAKEQDNAALHIIKDWKHVTQSELETAIKTKNFDSVWTKIAPIWASIPVPATGNSYHKGQNARDKTELNKVFLSSI